MSGDKKSILICGNYGAGNIGDDAILGGLINLCHSAAMNAELTVMSADPGATRLGFRVKTVWLFPAGVRSVLRFLFGGRAEASIRALWRADLVLLGGGGLFNDERKWAVWIWFVQFWWFWIFRKKVFCVAQSVGPLNSWIGRKMAGFVFRNSAAVTVRDEQSRNLLKKLGVEDVVVLADPAYAVGYAQSNAINRQKQVVLTMRSWVKGDEGKINLAVAEIVDWLAREHDLKTIFVPFQSGDESDLERFNGIVKLVKNRSSLELMEAEDYGQAMQIIGRSELVIGMRLHSIIFAVLCRTPFVALSYSKKVRDFVETLGLEGFCLDYGKVEVEDLKRVIGKALREKGKVAAKLEKNKLMFTYKFFQHEKMIRDLLE